MTQIIESGADSCHARAMKTTLRSKDFSCPSCVANIESTLSRIDGVEEATVRFNSGRIEVKHDPLRVDVEALRSVVRKLGYETEISPL